MDAGAFRVHRIAVPLTGILLAAFVSATWLYSQFGHQLVLGVFEANQVHRFERLEGEWAEKQLRDYLRIDPSSTRVRGLLIDAMIARGDTGGAMDVAAEGLAGGADEADAGAQLLLVRARIADGKLREAADSLASVVARLPRSADAHYYLAQLAAARGDFAAMRAEFEEVAEAGTRDSSDYFAAKQREARKTLRPLDSAVLTRTDESSIDFVRALLVLGRVDHALRIAAEIQEFGDAADVRFWRGVREEELGERENAVQSYSIAANQHNALAAAALGRLQGG